MKGEIKYFRKRFFGGFNREDVVEYIAKLAQERNGFREARNVAEQEAQKLSIEIEALRLEIEEAKCEADKGRDAKDALEQDKQTLASLIASLRDESATLRDKVDTLNDELEMAKLEVEEGQRYKAEALEARGKVQVLEDARRKLAELVPVFECMCTALSAEEQLDA